MSLISLEELYEISQHLKPDEVILDVRTPQEWSLGHIKGSLNIDHQQVYLHVDKLKAYKKITIYCRMGGRAKTAYDTLKGLGVQGLQCLGDCGFQAWCDEDYPVQR